MLFRVAQGSVGETAQKRHWETGSNVVQMFGSVLKAGVERGC